LSNRAAWGKPTVALQSSIRPLPLGRPRFGVVEEAGGDLDREAVQALDVGRLHVDLAVVGGDVDPHDRRGDGSPFGQRDERFLHRRDGFAVQRHALAKLGFGQERDGHVLLFFLGGGYPTRQLWKSGGDRLETI